MIKNILFILACIIILYFYTWYLEQKSLYYPLSQLEATPADNNINYEDVYFFTKDKIKLNGWFIPALNSKYTVILFHGNGGNISHRIEKINFFHQLQISVFIFDYRGYGKSRGFPSEPGLYQDAAAAYRWVLARMSKDNTKQKIIVYGESLGGAVALDLAIKQEVSAVILESTFTNVRDMAKIFYPFLPEIVIKSKFDSISKVANLKVPLLCMHSVNDDIVPYTLGKRLFERALPPKIFLELTGGHNESFYLSILKIKNGIENLLENIEFKN
ncbi:MAG: alpha/beta hydrolase [Candidatus Omnitrophota bacterium]